MNELSWANGSQGQVLMGGEERERERENWVHISNHLSSVLNMHLLCH